MRGKHRLSTNSEHISQLQRVGAKMAEAVSLPDKAWEFVVVDSNAVNAFVTHRDEVGVNSGMFKLTIDDAGLAVVVGHEMAHAAKRAQGKRRPGISKEKRKNAEVDFVRRHENEMEADRMGMYYMAKAGYDPHAAIQFWMRAVLYCAARGHDSNAKRKHPDVSLRLKAMEEYLPEAITEYRKYAQCQ